MKKIHYYSLALLSTLFLFISCSDTDADIFEEEAITSNLPSDVRAVILERGFNLSDFEYKVIKFGDNAAYEIILSQGDVAIPKDQFLEIYGNENDENRQSRTEFLVDTDEFNVINVYAFTGAEPAGFGLTPKAVEAVMKAVENWNKANSDIKMDVTVGDDFFAPQSVFETFVGASPNISGFGGFADFPDANNSPGDFMFISPDANQFAEFNEEGLEHLITHELGHTIGFRHTDWNTRRSCVEAGISDEEVSEESAASILGTLPISIYQSNSIMNACFKVDQTNGELTFFDRGAVRQLYPKQYF